MVHGAISSWGRPVCLLSLGLVLLLAACGQSASRSPAPMNDEAPQSPSAAAPSSADLETSGTLVSEPGSAGSSADPQAPAWEPPSDSVRQAFAQLAADDLGFALLVPAELPAGTVPAEAWRPLDDGATQAPQPNPLLSGTEGEREVRLLLQADGGFLEIIEGMRGDLGDLPYEPVDLAHGGTAGLYRVMGGSLVQWSREGVWYAVYGKGLPAEVVVRVARGMKE